MKTFLITTLCIFLFISSYAQDETIKLNKCDTLKSETILHEHVPVSLIEFNIVQNGTYKLSINGNLRPVEIGNKDWWMEFTFNVIINNEHEISFRKGQLISSNNANFKLNDQHSVTNVFQANDKIKLSLIIDRSMVDGIKDHEDTQLDRESIICLQRIL